MLRNISWGRSHVMSSNFICPLLQSITLSYALKTIKLSFYENSPKKYLSPLICNLVL